MSGLNHSNLPTGWTWARLADILSQPLINGRSVKTLEGGFPVLRLTALKSNGVDLSESKPGAWTEEQATPFLTTEGDFLLSRGNGSLALVGRGALVQKNPIKVAFPDTMIRVRPNPSIINLRYLKYIWDSPLVRAQIERSARTTAGIYKINQEVLRSIRFPLAPLREQNSIVEALEGHLSRLDAAYRTLQHAGSLFPLQRRTLYTSAAEGKIFDGTQAVPDFLAQRRKIWETVHKTKRYKEPSEPNLQDTPSKPENWRIFSLEALTDPTRTIRYGILMPRIRSGGTVPYIEVKDLKNCSLRGKQLHLTSKELDEQFAGARVQPGDVLLAVRGSYDRSAVVMPGMEGANISRDVARIAPIPGVDPAYIHLYLQSSFAQRYLKKHARGVAVKGVNIATIRTLPVAIPSFATQKMIVESTQQQITLIDVTENAVRLCSIRSAALRQSLLARAFEGLLVAQDPSDEDASILIDRIRSENEAQRSNRENRRTSRRSHKTAVFMDAPSPPFTTTAPIPSVAVQQELSL